jgi:hypothetical protein
MAAAETEGYNCEPLLPGTGKGEYRHEQYATDAETETDPLVFVEKALHRRSLIEIGGTTTIRGHINLST